MKIIYSLLLLASISCIFLLAYIESAGLATFLLVVDCFVIVAFGILLAFEFDKLK